MITGYCNIRNDIMKQLEQAFDTGESVVYNGVHSYLSEIFRANKPLRTTFSSSRGGAFLYGIISPTLLHNEDADLYIISFHLSLVNALVAVTAYIYPDDTIVPHVSTFFADQ